MFALGFASEASELGLRARQFFLPGGLVLESFQNLRGDRVLLLLRKSSHFAQSVFQQLSHKPSLAEHLKRCKKACIPFSERAASVAGDETEFGVGENCALLLFQPLLNV